MTNGFTIGLICLTYTSPAQLPGCLDSPLAVRGDPPPGGELAPRDKTAPRGKKAPGPRAPFAGAPNAGGDEQDSCYGSVIAVDKGSITVAAAPKKIDQYNAQGHFVKTIIVPAQPPRKFTAIGPLAAGGYLKQGVPMAQYRLSDVRVGDKVSFDWRRVGKVYEVHYVSIYRRPGGRVPPSPGEKPGESNPWHERCNAFQDLEEKGIPLPEKYRPKPPAESPLKIPVPQIPPSEGTAPKAIPPAQP